MGAPPGYRFVHDLPNKPLTGYTICRILKTKEIICKILETLELWFLWNFGETQAWGWWILSLAKLIIRPGVKGSLWRSAENQGKKGAVEAAPFRSVILRSRSSNQNVMLARSSSCRAPVAKEPVVPKVLL